MSNPISLTFNQGATVQFPITITATTGSPLGPVNLTGYTFAADIRKEYNTDVIASFVINETDLANGEFNIELSAAVSEALPMNSKGRVTSFVFDVDMYAPGSPQVVDTPITGYLKVAHRVTANV